MKGSSGTRTGVGPLRYLSAADLDACLPPVRERVALARRALVALARNDAEMPPKIGVHPRDGALLHAMPAWLRSADLVGLKWVSAFPGNKRQGLPAISGLVLLNDAETGLPMWIMDASRITAVRTAAVTGVAIDLFAPTDTARVTLLGTGVQALSHVEVIRTLLPGAQVVIYGRDPQRAQLVADEANADAGGGHVQAAPSIEAALDGAQVVVSVATLGAQAQRLTPADVDRGTLVVAVDFATYVTPELARGARAFVVDDRAQFMHYRDLGYFDGYPDPTRTMGELADSEGGRNQAGPVGDAHARPALVTHLGVGLADVVLADAVATLAAERGLGTLLER